MQMWFDAQLEQKICDSIYLTFFFSSSYYSRVFLIMLQVNLEEMAVGLQARRNVWKFRGLDWGWVVMQGFFRSRFCFYSSQIWRSDLPPCLIHTRSIKVVYADITEDQLARVNNKWYWIKVWFIILRFGPNPVNLDLSLSEEFFGQNQNSKTIVLEVHSLHCV